MALNSIGDMAQSFVLRRQTARTKNDANIAAQELTTGYTANIAKKLGGDISQLAGIESTLTRLKSYQVATNLSSTKATAMQSVLAHIGNNTDGFGLSLLDATNIENTRTLDSFVSDSTNRFEAVINSLNSGLGGKTLFAGVASDGPALASSDVILSAVEAAIAGSGAVSATDIETAVSTWFNDPAGYATIAYLGGAAASEVSISADDSISFDLTAMDPTIRDTLKSLALVAIVDRGNVVPNAETGTDLLQFAGTALLQNQADRAYLAGKLGQTQARIEQAQTRNEAEGTTLQLARSDLLAVDPYEAATRMQAAQTQLELLYSVTARLSQLNLVDFLR